MVETMVFLGVILGVAGAAFISPGTETSESESFISNDEVPADEGAEDLIMSAFRSDYDLLAPENSVQETVSDSAEETTPSDSRASTGLMAPEEEFEDTSTADPETGLLEGGSGNDILYALDEFDEMFGRDGMDKLFGGSTDDALYGGQDDDYLYGHEGDDFLFGGDDNDALFGDAGQDNLFGDDGSDTLNGGVGDDVLSGGLESGDDLMVDVLDGGDGDDVLILGKGDIATGGEGADTYRVLESVEGGIITVTDFDAERDGVVYEIPQGSDIALESQVLTETGLYLEFSDGAILHLDGVSAELDESLILFAEV